MRELLDKYRKLLTEQHAEKINGLQITNTLQPCPGDTIFTLPNGNTIPIGTIQGALCAHTPIIKTCSHDTNNGPVVNPASCRHYPDRAITSTGGGPLVSNLPGVGSPATAVNLYQIGDCFSWNNNNDIECIVGFDGLLAPTMDRPPFTCDDCGQDNNTNGISDCIDCDYDSNPPVEPIGIDPTLTVATGVSDVLPPLPTDVGVNLGVYDKKNCTCCKEDDNGTISGFSPSTPILTTASCSQFNDPSNGITNCVDSPLWDEKECDDREIWMCEGGNCFEHPSGTFTSQADCESKCGHSPRKNPEDDKEISRIKELF